MEIVADIERTAGVNNHVGHGQELYPLRDKRQVHCHRPVAILVRDQNVPTIGDVRIIKIKGFHRSDRWQRRRYKLGSMTQSRSLL